MSGRIRWLLPARYDLIRLFNWIADRADVDIAEDYTTRIEAHTSKLLIAPHGGSPRNELQAGIRSTVYRRRTVIFYRVTDNDEIEIVRLSHSGRDPIRMFGEDD